jgi:signal transduction histidine kinase
MTEKRIRRYLASAAALLCAIVFLSQAFAASSGSAAAGAGAKRTVRVGLPESDTVSSDIGINRTIAFGQDYLNAIAEYAGWDCVYVKATWADCVNMVKNGDIDILFDVSKTDERLGWFDFSSESMGTEMCYLFGRGDTEMKYDDFSVFNGMTVGYEEGSTLIGSLRKYGAENGFTFSEKAYKSGAAMFAALDAGEVDAVVQTNFYDTPPGHVILAKCDPRPIYIVTNKRIPALKTELDSAMAQIFSYIPGFNANMYKYHLGASVGQAFGYTKQELEYLASKPVVDVYYETDWSPFEYDSGGEVCGITPDVLRAIGADTGISFRFVLAPSTHDIYAGVEKSSADTVMAVSYDYTWAKEHDLLATQPYVSGSVMRVVKNSLEEPKTVAVVKDGYLANQIRQKYPSLTPVSYLTFAECMDAVLRGGADCTFLNYYQASYYRSMGAYSDFSYQPDDNITQSISLGVTMESNPALFGVLSKSLQHISDGKLQSILSENSAQGGALSLHLLLRRYPAQMALLIGALVTLVGFLIIVIMSSSARRRQNIRLAAAKSEADAANRAKSEFLSRMSHDMRTPLNGILGMTYIAGEQDNPRRTSDCLSKIDTSSRFLLSLINDVLDMTKAESGNIELHPEPYPRSEFEQYINAVIRPLCDGRKQELVVDASSPEGCVPLLDKVHFNQIIFNLLSNAVKYTPEGGRISFSSVFSPCGSDKLSACIRVADNGIGMSEKFQEVLFSPFTQEERDDISESRGSGLGLAITKRLVELMGGTISVESEIGKGSVFTISFETGYVRAEDAPGTEARAAESGAANVLAGKRVLLCEDHPLNQEIALALLGEKNMLVDVAGDGQRGVDAFSRSPVGYYDVVLMDIRMPVMDGYEAARSIRALDRPDAESVPILAMTADAFADDVRKCFEAGMDGHISKPIDPPALYAKLAETLQNGRYRGGAKNTGMENI